MIRRFWEAVEGRLVVLLATAFAAIEAPVPDPDADGDVEEGERFDTSGAGASWATKSGEDIIDDILRFRRLYRGDDDA